MLRPSTTFLLALGLALALPSCSTNPATGKTQLNLYSEASEIQMGREADRGIVGQIGLVPDEDLQEMVSRIGHELARTSERPDLPWEFKVLDDPAVNAFALPGGYVYVTRGMLAHMGSEAELAGVLGHEIGHVTARHGVNRMSKAQLGSLALGVGMVMSEEVRQFGGLLQTSMGLLFLKFSRDDERQSDELGLRYALANGYPPPAVAEVFATLDRVGEASGQRLPGWLSTHPAPANRHQTILALGADAPADVRNADWRRRPYLRALDGTVFGPDPREGYFEGSTFVHPEMAFRLRFPDGWVTQNQKQAVLAMSPEKDAMIQLSLAAEDSPEAAAREFANQPGLEIGQANWAGQGVSRRFRTTQGNPLLDGSVLFSEHGGRVFRILGLATQQRWGGVDRATADTFRSFERVTDRRLLDVEPLRIRLAELDRPTTLRDLHGRWTSPVDLATLALINGLDADEPVEAGTWIKRVEGVRVGD